MDNNKLSEVQREIFKLKDEKHWPIIPYDVANAIIAEVRAHNCKNSLELGGCVGCSALNFLSGMGDEGKLTTIEATPERAKILRENVIRAGVADKITVLEGDAKTLLPTLTGPFDCVFIDAMKREYLAYLLAIEPQLQSGCLILADNVQSHASKMQDFLEYMQNSPEYETHIKTLGGGLLLAVKI
ncbi:class I SAM-dependent methyltransferase [Candidatus Falkowbacteria bacterium]|nr:class I SAM-dependent methyltransferase [Candidatus Falkowbacteria bacterium]